MFASVPREDDHGNKLDVEIANLLTFSLHHHPGDSSNAQAFLYVRSFSDIQDRAHYSSGFSCDWAETVYF